MKNEPNLANLFIRIYLKDSLGLSDKQIATRLGFGRQNVNAVLNGRSSISKSFAMALECEFGLNAASILAFQAVSELEIR